MATEAWGHLSQASLSILLEVKIFRETEQNPSLKPVPQPYPRSSSHPPMVPPTCCHPRTPPGPQTPASSDSHFPWLGGAEQVKTVLKVSSFARPSAPLQASVCACLLCPQPLTSMAQGHLEARPPEARHGVKWLRSVQDRGRDVPPLNCGTEGKLCLPFPIGGRSVGLPWGGEGGQQDHQGAGRSACLGCLVWGK